MQRWLVTFALFSTLAYAGDVFDNTLDYSPGDVFARSFTVHNVTGEAVIADSTPVINVRVDGATETVTVAYLILETGEYSFSFTIPDTLLPGQLLEVVVKATVEAIEGKAILYRKTLVHKGRRVR